MSSRYFKFLFVVCTIPFVLFQCASPQEDSYRLEEYYGIINEAENKIVEGHPEEALKLYESAFLLAKERVFARDLYNAAVSASKVNDDEAIAKYAVQLVRRGIQPQEILSNRTLTEPVPATKLNELQKALDKNYNEFERSRNTHLIASIDSLVQVDQYFRVMEDPYKNYGDTIRKIDIKGANYLRNLLTQTDYPLESAIGTSFPDNSLPGYIVFRHVYQQGIFSLDSTLRQAVLQLKATPQLYSSLNELQNPEIPYGTSIYQVGEAYYGKAYSSEEERQINDKRISIGLDALDNYRRKFSYAMQNPEYKFDFGYSIIDMSAIVKPGDKRLSAFKKLYPLEAGSSGYSQIKEGGTFDEKTLTAFHQLIDAANKVVVGSTEYLVTLNKDSLTGAPFIHFSKFITDIKPLDEGGDFRSRYFHFVDFRGERKALSERVLISIADIKYIDLYIGEEEKYFVFHSLEDKPFQAVPKKNPKEATVLPLGYQPTAYEVYIPVPKEYKQEQVQFLLDKFSL